MATARPRERGGGSLRRAFRRLTTSTDEFEAVELREDSQDAGATPVVDCLQRHQATVRGTLRTVTLRPRAGVPALEAELYDGTGVVRLYWLGRRQIGGIEPGRVLEAEGLLTTCDRQRTIFNPKYTLRPVGGR
jgi:hypothetical protein